MSIAFGLILLIAIVAIAGVGALAAGAVALALKSKRDYKAAGEIVPGEASSAPEHWAGAHSPEAKLHRRLVAAAASARQQRSGAATKRHAN